MKYNYLLLLLVVNGENIIKNIKLPSCKNCIYYKPDNYNIDFTSSFTRCEKFGEKNIITDKIKYDFTELCRENESKCGKEGKYFEEEKYIDMKILIHKFNVILLIIINPISIIFGFVPIYLIMQSQ